MTVAATTDCPACEEGYICRQGEGCLLVEVIDSADARSAASSPLASPESLESSAHGKPLGFEPSMELLPAPRLGWYPSGGSKA